MIMTVIGLVARSRRWLLVAVTAVSGDIHLTPQRPRPEAAYEAAKAGINDYVFHLHEETDYWAHCTDVPTPNAVNQTGLDRQETAGARAAPAPYAIELLPATGQTKYTQCNTSNTATASMLESSGPLKGTFRIRSTGFAGDSKVSIIATFKPASFLDYVYFTQRETSDPVTYG